MICVFWSLGFRVAPKLVYEKPEHCDRDKHKTWNVKGLKVAYPSSLHKTSLFMNYVTDIKKKI